MKFLLLLFLFLTVSCSHMERIIQSQADTLKQSNWHLQITKTNKAWGLSRGSKDIIVAIIDTGIDIHHPDLSENLWKNEKEFKGKPGVDDDHNGYIDDIHGWNFTDNSNRIWDHHGHGTHVAGIIGGKGKICEPGVAPEVQLMVLKYYDSNSSGNKNLKNTIKAIRYAIENGAHMINFSGGGYEPSRKEESTIAEAFLKDILFVAAAGNDKTNLENKPYYPASYKLPNIFSVGSTDVKDHHSYFSNRGSNITAHAPGTKIFSTLPPSRCGYLTGTSQSTPIFTGGAVLIKASKPNAQVVDIINYLKKTTDTKSDLKDKNESGGRANLYRALGSEHFNVTINETEIEYSENQKIGQHQEDENFLQPPDPFPLFLPEEFTKLQKTAQNPADENQIKTQKTNRNPASVLKERKMYFNDIKTQYDEKNKILSPQEVLDILTPFQKWP